MTDLDILLVYKKSRLDILKKNHQFSANIPDLEDLEFTHKEHHQNLEKAEKIIAKLGLSYESCYRSNLTRKLAKNKLVISFGGDGTLLDTSHYLKESAILGVNSNPNHSIGALCAADMKNFESFLSQILEDKIRPTLTPRVSFSINNSLSKTLALNELLISSRNPAATSTYEITHAGKTENQKSAGIWISTPAGTTGALASSGGQVMNLEEQKLQFKIREPYFNGKNKIKILSGFLEKDQKLAICSKMILGHIYPDGPHKSQIFSYGTQASIQMAEHPLNLYVSPQMLAKRKKFQKLD